ncbi:hypothetical protein NDU88_003141 [Pleurodeles waltl]|uniref:Uncharacterized protein n=1 Tax=Pleurodeles waltl TaxID=8319 RepID=A0AAV7M2L3_PLEWA|nr:hypothetical protein NDU88_003141 [Pleurodeles waltl]
MFRGCSGHPQRHQIARGGRGTRGGWELLRLNGQRQQVAAVRCPSTEDRRAREPGFNGPMGQESRRSKKAGRTRVSRPHLPAPLLPLRHVLTSNY